MEKAKGKATVVIPGLYVEGYKNRVYRGKNGPVVIFGHANCDTWDAEATQKLGKIMRKLYGRISPEDVEKVYVYVDMCAEKCALLAAKQLAGRGSKLELLASRGYDHEDNESIVEAAARRLRAQITWVDRNVSSSLGSIVDDLVKKTKRSSTIEDWARSSEDE
jgi:hypothetical protein